MAIDLIAKESQAQMWKQNFNGLSTEATIGNQKVILLKPMTYMNNSGVSVQSCANFYKILPEEILVIHDELDIPLCKIKPKLGVETEVIME